MYDFNFYIGQSNRVPDDAYWRAVENGIKVESQEAKEARATQAGFRKLRGQYSHELNSLIKEAHIGKYRAARDKYRETLCSARAQQPPPDAATLKEIKRQSQASSMQALGKLGVDPKKVESLQKRYHQQASALSQKDLPEESQAESNRSKRVKNQTFEPPFSGWGWARSWDESRQAFPNPIHERWLDSDAGEIGNRTVVEISDADDSDFSWIKYRTGVRQWYQMPRLGQVQVRMEWEGIDTPYSGRIEAEEWWGENSAVDVRQNVKGYARIIAPVVGPRILATVGGGWPMFWGEYRDRDEDDHEWSRLRLDAGDRVSIEPFVLPGVIDEGEWVLVEAGIWTKNYAWSNDCAVRSEQTQRVILRELGLSSTGGD